MLLAEIAATWTAVANTSSRRAKINLLAACLRRVPPEEIMAATAYLSGELRQRQIGVGWATLRDLPSPADRGTLSVADVDTAAERIGACRGPGSTARRRFLVKELFAAATADEQRFLQALLLGELRQGALEGVMTEAIAAAAKVPVSDVRRAVLLAGDLRRVAAAALTGGAAALAAFRLELGHPLAPMLAQAVASVNEAVERISPAAVDWKLDGIRVQVHRDGPEIAVFTRSLDDITSRVPEVVQAVRDLKVRSIVLDGEVIALQPDGRPAPFQVTASRVGRRSAPGASAPPLNSYYFDLLHLDGEDLLDAPAYTRWTALVGAVPEAHMVPRIVASTVEQVSEWFAVALAAGHEGIVVKALDAPYEAGRRGGAWLKVKPRHTLDLVVLAAEWGHGRRRGWLSNLHLGARDPAGGYVMLGKTFKGLTDELLAWQTQQLLQLETHRDSWTVYVRPALVVEIAFDGVQTSPRYPAGMALRFARVLRYRPDKSPDQADTIDEVRAIHEGRVSRRIVRGRPTPS